MKDTKFFIAATVAMAEMELSGELEGITLEERHFALRYLMTLITTASADVVKELKVWKR